MLNSGKLFVLVPGSADFYQVKRRQDAADCSNTIDDIGNQRVFPDSEIVSHDPNSMRCMPNREKEYDEQTCFAKPTCQKSLKLIKLQVGWNNAGRDQQEKTDQRGNNKCGQRTTCCKQAPNDRFFCNSHNQITPASQKMNAVTSTQAT